MLRGEDRVENTNKLSDEVIALWPEVLKDVDVHTVPIEYLQSINVEFNDGNTWHIDIDPRDEFDLLAVEENIEDLFREYNDVITKVDFRLNIAKVKKDIQKRTNRFLKKRK